MAIKMRVVCRLGSTAQQVTAKNGGPIDIKPFVYTL